MTAGAIPVQSLSGTEQVVVDNGGAVIVTATTQQIANLAGTGSQSAITALSTVGAGTITAAGIVGKITSRTGSQSNTAFTDTTDTAAHIISALADPVIGQTWEWTYQNTTNANATIQGGAGVTVSGITLVPAGTSARYLVKYSAANTFTITGFLQTDPATASGTFTATGSEVTITDSRITANSVVVFGLKTAGGTIAGAPYMSAVTAGTSFKVKTGGSDTSVYNYTIIG